MSPRLSTEHQAPSGSLPERPCLPLPTRSPKGVVLRVVRSAMSADWAPYSAAEELVRYVDGEGQLLEVARARIEACIVSSATLMQARALATLKVAINLLPEQRDRR